jgi:hypothetical protein
VQELDFVRDVTIVDIRYRVAPAPRERSTRARSGAGLLSRTAGQAKVDETWSVPALIPFQSADNHAAAPPSEAR